MGKLEHATRGDDLSLRKMKRIKMLAEYRDRIKQLESILYKTLEEEYHQGYNHGFEDAMDEGKPVSQ